MSNVNTTQGLVVLAKSDPYPASIQEAVWSLVSASNDTIFSTWYNTTYETGDLACNVNDDGVFTFTGQYNGTGRESYRYFTNNSVGEWSAVNLWPGDFFLTPLWSNSTTPDPFILFTPLGLPPDNNNTDFMPTEGKDSTPFMAQFRFEAENNVSTVDNTTLRIGFGSNVSAEWWYRYSTSYLTETNGTVRSVRYGNESLWVLMETGSPYYVTLNNITYPRFNRTLAIYNDTSPFYLTKYPVPLLSTPWDLTCYESEIQTWAVFGNKMYYSCRSDNETAQTGHLYSFDTTTNQMFGPVDTNISCTGKRSLTLVPGKPGSPSPAYGLVSDSKSISILDLGPTNYGNCTTFYNNGSGFVQANAIIEALSSQPQCFENCTSSTVTAAIAGGIVVGVAVVMFVSGLAMLYRRRTMKQQKLAPDASREAALDTIEK
ncbi:hypothetical protein CPC16_011894 [Podila verticillata]|nr:hypothetical protein CPC16_011894 [Podila verticillata]